MNHEEIRRELAVRLAKLLADMSHLPKELRHYQRESIEAALSWLNDPNGTKRAYIEHATGLGKTELFASIVSACIGMRTLIIVPSKLLLEQTVRRIHQFTKGMLGHLSSLKSIKDKDDKEGEIIAIRGHEHSGVVVAVGASFKRYAQKLAQEFNPQLIIRDECHWSYPEPEQRALALFPEAVMLGLSATPDYLGTTGREGYIPVTLDNGQVLYAPADLLGQTRFQTRLDQRSVRWGIENGWLAPLAWGHIDFDVSLDKVPLQATREGGMDYKPEELQSLLSRHWPFMLETVVRLYKEGEYDLPNRQTVSICASVREAEQLAEAVKGAGIPAACITGSTPTKERNKLLAAYKAGDLKFLSSVMVLREGWDSPNAEVCMMLRPTRSRVFYVQSMGRVLRLPLDGSFKVALILDAYFLNTHYAPLSAPVLFGQPGMQYVDGEILIDRATNIPTVSPYVKPNIKPRIVVVEAMNAEIEYYAGSNGFFEADGEKWGTVCGLSKELKVADASIRARLSGCRSRQGKDSGGHRTTFYAYSDVKAACADLLDTANKAGEDGFFMADGEKWGMEYGFYKEWGLSVSALNPRLKNCRSRQGKTARNQITTFYAYSDVKAACADLLDTANKADDNGFFVADNEEWGNLRGLSKALGIDRKSISDRIGSCRSRSAKSESGIVTTFYAYSDVKAACADLLNVTDKAGSDGFFTAEGERWGNIRAFSKEFSITPDAIHSRITARSCRSLLGKTSRGAIATFYAYSDVKAACADLLNVTDKAGSDGFFTAEGERWGSESALINELCLSRNALLARISGSCRKRQGKTAGGGLATFYAYSDVKAACADLLNVTDKAGSDGFFTAEGERWGSESAFAEEFHVNVQAIEVRINSACRSRRGRTNAGSLTTFYAYSDVKAACADLLTDKAGSDGFFTAEGEDWGHQNGLCKRMGLYKHKLKALLSSCRSRRGRTWDGHSTTFYAYSDVKTAYEASLAKKN